MAITFGYMLALAHVAQPDLDPGHAPQPFHLTGFQVRERHLRALDPFGVARTACLGQSVKSPMNQILRYTGLVPIVLAALVGAFN
jgi:hypothetical protein